MGQVAKPSRLIPALATGGLSEGFGFRPLLEEGAKALTPKLPPLPPLPGLKEDPAAAGGQDKAVQQAVAEGSRRRKLARGIKDTILKQLMPKDATALGETVGT